MNEVKKVAYIISQSACATIERYSLPLSFLPPRSKKVEQFSRHAQYPIGSGPAQSDTPIERHCKYSA